MFKFLKQHLAVSTKSYKYFNMPIETELNFSGNDPGAVKYGNFINYYSFHSTKERTKNLHPSMFATPLSNERIVCLDVGCNTGELTKELYQYLKSVVYPKSDLKILGVDIDPTLIERGIQLNENPNISYMPLNIICRKEQEKITQYLNLNEKEKFDIIFCFSVTMWIHINNGDDGLKEFLKYIKSITKTIIIEPQPWKCYRNAQRRLKKSGGNFPHYTSLKIRSDVDAAIEHDILVGNDTTKVYESQNSSWDRKVISFHISTKGQS